MKETDFYSYFSVIKDERQEGKVRHKLIDILFIAVSATISNCDDWIDMQDFAEEREEWLRQYLELPNGIPSHDTIERVFRMIDPKQFEKCFSLWTQEMFSLTKGSVIAIDGKTMRGTGNAKTGKGPIHIVSAWINQNRLVLGQVKTDEKSNEITAIPELLDLLTLTDCIVTIDAMGCQKDIAKKIVDKKGEYVLALKGNHGNLHDEVALYFEDAAKSKFKEIEVKTFSSIEKDHGRIDKRTYYLVENIEWLSGKGEWKALNSIGMAIRESEINGTKSYEKRYFICSFKGSAEEFGNAVRSHWGIETTHWYLDVVFKEDACRVRKDNSPQNLAVLKRLALNILRMDADSKRSLKKRRFKACLNQGYLDNILNRYFEIKRDELQ
jgi:predicted transposase YbfD/YdcC